MALPFNPPNPYGSYFNFGSQYGGDPTPAMWRQPNYPNLGTPVSQGVASAMGSPSGGINPTESEFNNTRLRDIAFQQFIDRTIKDDPRTRTVGNMLLSGIYGDDAQAKARAMAKIGGADAYNGMVGTLMNLPGLSGYFGGSTRSLAIGSLAAATSGLTMNGYGVFGDKSMNLRFADELMRQVSTKFYSANGNPILSMTNGLNRDQLGGVMVQAASQGAFSGLDMGTFQKMDQAGNKLRFVANSDTTSKITEFVKSTTKALGSLIDVYGNISSGELMQKAQQITGMDLSRLENAEIMNARIQKLRDTAIVTGIDTQSAYDMSARSIDYGSAIGLRPEMAGTIGGYAANQGMRDYRARQMNVHGFYTNTISPMEMMQGITRDQAAMSQDPLGARLGALEMLIKNRGMSDEDAAALRTKASGFSANAAGVSGLDNLIRSNFGVSSAGLIRGMGGPAALQQQLDPTQQQNLVEMNANNLRTRQSNRIKANLQRGGMMPIGSTASQTSAMHRLVTSLDNDTMEKVLAAQSDAEVATIINPILGTNTSDLVASARVIRGMGEQGRMAYKNVRSSIQADELTRGFITREGRERNQWMNTPQITDEFRGQMLGGGFFAGMMDKYSGNDPQSKLAWLTNLRPGIVAGVGRGESINADFSSMVVNGELDIEAWRKGMQGWRKGLNKTDEGQKIAADLKLNGVRDNGQISDYERGVLENSFNKLRSSEWRQKNMGQFDFFSINNGRNVAFARKSDMGLKEKYGSDIESMTLLADKLRAEGGQEAVVRKLEQDIAMLSTGGGIYGHDKDGNLSARMISDDPKRYMAKDSDIKKAQRFHMDVWMDKLRAGKLSDAELKKIGSNDTLSSDMLTRIKIEEDMLKGIVNPEGRKEREKKIRQYEDAAKKIGGSPKGVYSDAEGPVAGANRITGELRLVSDGNDIVAKLKDVMMNPPK